MNEFKNELILNETAYQNGLFPKIPNFEKRGSAFVLTNGFDDDILISERTTVKQIRKGKYTSLVEISVIPYVKEIRFTSPSKEASYSFDVYVKAVIQVKDPIRFYENRNLDVDAYFETLFLLDVKKITRCYSILDYNGLDDELTKKLSSYNTFDEATGFSYMISAVDAQPGAQAKAYVDQNSKQQLDIELKKNARELSKTLAGAYEDAIRTEVVEGKRTEAEAIIEIENYKKANFETHLKQYENLLEKGFITDSEARRSVRMALDSDEIEKQIGQQETYPNQGEDIFDLGMDQFYTEEG